MNASQLIDDLGGTMAVARMCTVQPPTVSNWRLDGIPGYRLDFLRLLRPDVLGGISNEQITPVAASTSWAMKATRN